MKTDRILWSKKTTCGGGFRMIGYFGLNCILILLVPCCAPSGMRGRTGEWVKGRGLSLNASFAAQFVTSPLSPMLHIRNDSPESILVFPIRVIAWFSKSGKQQSTIAFAEGDKGGLISAELQIRNADGAIREVTLSPDTQQLNLQPGEDVYLSPGFWRFRAGITEDLEKIQVFIGHDGSKEQEVFVIERR